MSVSLIKAVVKQIATFAAILAAFPWGSTALASVCAPFSDGQWPKATTSPIIDYNH